MIRRITYVLAAAAALGAAPALADAATGFRAGDRSVELAPYLQCVPYAREVSGIQIYGDAHTWWGQAEGRYNRGNQPRVGAVMAFQPHRNMRLGHVAAVSRIIDSRNILLRHANWSPINGRRGQIEDNVRAVDVSPNNDWSQVRVWYDPIQGLGKTPWPVQGFIYNKGGSSGGLAGRTRMAVRAPVTRATSPEFLNAFASFSEPNGSNQAASGRTTRRSAAQRRARGGPRQTNPRSAHVLVKQDADSRTHTSVQTQPANSTERADPVSQAISLYD